MNYRLISYILFPSHPLLSTPQRGPSLHWVLYLLLSSRSCTMQRHLRCSILRQNHRRFRWQSRNAEVLLLSRHVLPVQGKCEHGYGRWGPGRVLKLGLSTFVSEVTHDTWHVTHDLKQQFNALLVSRFYRTSCSPTMSACTVHVHTHAAQTDAMALQPSLGREVFFSRSLLSSGERPLDSR